MSDAHVHMGYFDRYGHEEPFYYSPRRVAGLLGRCKAGEFIVSSTCAQVECIPLEDIFREAREMRRVAGAQAHQFFWLSGHLYDEDRELTFLDTGLYEGVKFHEGETAWSRARRKDIERILAMVGERGLPVQFHCGPLEGCKPGELARWAEKFPGIRFDFAHCYEPEEMALVMADHENVYVDALCLYEDDMRRLADFDWHGRLMFGSDFPARHRDPAAKGFAIEYRRMQRLFALSGVDGDAAFRRFVGHVHGEDVVP